LAAWLVLTQLVFRFSIRLFQLACLSPTVAYRAGHGITPPFWTTATLVRITTVQG